MKCKKCGKELKTLMVIALEENEYTGYPIRTPSGKIVIHWTFNGVNLNTENYHDLCCPFCEILIERMYDLKKVEEYMKKNFKPLSDYDDNEPVEARGSI